MNIDQEELNKIAALGYIKELYDEDLITKKEYLYICQKYNMDCIDYIE